MKKLDEIPRKNIFKVPEGYFDTLPGIIQSRVTQEKVNESPAFVYALRFVVPVVLLMIITGLWFIQFPNNSQTPEEMLANVDTEDLIAFLEDADLSTEELLETIDLTSQDIYEIENEVYDITLDEDGNLDELLEVFDVEFDNQ